MFLCTHLISVVPLETRSSQEPTERVAYELMLANRPSQTCKLVFCSY